MTMCIAVYGSIENRLDADAMRRSRAICGCESCKAVLLRYKRREEAIIDNAHQMAQLRELIGDQVKSREEYLRLALDGEVIDVEHEVIGE